MKKTTYGFDLTWHFAGLLLALIFISQSVTADERILAYTSNIQVFPDSTMQVREEIRVRAEGKQIRRGIYRDFPTQYRDQAGNRYEVGFNVVSVLRDGSPEAFHIESRSNGVRVYVGQKNVHLQSGEYTYTLVYRTNRQLGFFSDHDELYWNVTGNGWAFPIDAVSARVTLPEGILPDEIQVEAYTGGFGARGGDYQATVTPVSEALFTTIRSLDSREGLTIVVSWPKGFVQEPSTSEHVGWLLRDNELLMIGLLGLGVLLGYYLLVWLKVGKDLPTGVIIPRYYPPKNYSPAASRFIHRMSYDHKAFATAIVNLAVKGMVQITEEGNEFTLRQLDPEPKPELAPGEKVLLNTLFSANSIVTLKQSNHALLSKTIKAHKKSLKRNYEKIYFITNSAWLVPGVLFTLLILAVIFIKAPSGDGRFMLLWLSIWSLGVIALVTQAFKAWRHVSSNGVMAAVGKTIFAIPFLAGEIFGIYVLAESVSLWVIVVIVMLLATSSLFYEWLKAPTHTGRKLMDKLDGFREYLDIAEKDELNLKNPPKKTPELFEIYLPFAMALDVEQHWAKRFSDVFAALEKEGTSYHPGWYHGRNWRLHDPAGFAGVMGSAVSAAISSSSTAPGSSSGGGGGGSSGGGGGGGGGGGW